MGEFADYALGEVFEAEEQRANFRAGRMSNAEAYDRGIIDERGAEYGTATKKTCRACGVSGLSWGRHRGKWRLFHAGRLHQCSVNPLNE